MRQKTTIYSWMPSQFIAFRYPKGDGSMTIKSLKDYSWNTFEKSGSIESFLLYREMRSISETKDENGTENNGRCYQGNTIS